LEYSEGEEDVLIKWHKNYDSETLIIIHGEMQEEL
jgi:hypothetical protein